MFSLLIQTEYVLVLLTALTIPNFFILDGYSYRYNIDLVFGGMPGVVNNSACEGFFDCFYRECSGNLTEFNFNDGGCGMSLKDFLGRFSRYSSTNELIKATNVACVVYSCLTLFLTLVYSAARRVKGLRGRSVVVGISTIVILSEIVVRVSLVSLVLRISEIDVYLPNFLTDYNKAAMERTVLMGVLLSLTIIFSSFSISFKSVDPGMSEFTPLAWNRGRSVSVSDDETTGD